MRQIPYFQWFSLVKGSEKGKVILFNLSPNASGGTVTALKIYSEDLTPDLPAKLINNINVRSYA